MAVQYNADGTVRSLQQEDTPSGAFNVGRQIKSLFTDDQVKKEVIEGGKAFLTGAIRGTKDVLELPLDAARYAPYAALPAEALFKAGASTIAGFQDEKEDDMNYNLDTLMNDYKRTVDTWQEYSHLNDAQDYLNEAFEPLFQSLSREYEGPVYDGIETFGEFLTTIPAIKAVVAGTRAFQVASLKPLIKESREALAKELGKESTEEVLDNPRDRYQAVTDQGQSITDGVRKELTFLEKNEKKIKELNQKNKELLSLKRSIVSDSAAAGAGAFAITYVENVAPDQAHWLAPLAGISAAVLIPPVMINNARAISFNMLAMTMRSMGREDDALDMFIRARGMNPNMLLDEGGNQIVSDRALRKKKQALLASTPQELKFYSKVAKEIEKLPFETKNQVYQSAITFKKLFDKFAAKAEAQGLNDVADAFVPLVHNILQMAGVRSLQQALLKKADAGFFLTPKKLFQNQLSSELDHLLQTQELTIDKIRADLAELAKVAGDDLNLGQVLGAMEDMVNETDAMFRAVSKNVGEGGSNLKKQLAYNTIGRQDAKSIEGVSQQARFLRDKYKIEDPETIENVRVRNINLDKKFEQRSIKRRNELYDAATKKPDGTYVKVTTAKAKEYVDNIIKERNEAINLGKDTYKPSELALTQFLTDTQIQYLDTIRVEEIDKFDELLQNAEEFFDVERNNYVIAAREIMNEEDAIRSFNSSSGYNTYRGYVEGVDDPDQSDKLVRYLHSRFINPKSNKKNLGGLGRVSADGRAIIKNINSDEDFTSQTIRVVDVLNIKRKYNRIVHNDHRNINPVRTQQAKDGVSMADLFLKQMEKDPELAEFAEKLKVANNNFAANLLPQQARGITSLRRRRKQNEHRTKAQEIEKLSDNDKLASLTEAQTNDLAIRIARDDVEGYDIIRSLIDPVTFSQLQKNGEIANIEVPLIILRAFRNNLETPEEIADLQDSVMRSIVHGINEGRKKTSSNGALNLVSAIDENFVNRLRRDDFITEEMFQELQPFVQFKKSINKDKNADLAKRFDEISADLDGFTRQYKDDIGSSFLNQIIKQKDRAMNPEEASEKIADLITRIAATDTRLGVRTFFRPLSKEDVDRLDDFDKFIFNEMDFDEAEKFRKFMRGEAEQPFTDIETGQPRVVDEDPFERLLKSFEGRVNGDKIIDGLSKVFTEAALSKGFKRSDRQSQLGSRISFGMFGRKFNSGAVYELESQALTDAVNEYKPFYKAILKRKVAQGKKEDAEKFKNIIQELDDVTEISKSVNFEIGQGEEIQGMPSPFSIESIISRVYGVVRGVVSARYVFSEWGIRQMRQGQAEVMRSFLTDPTSVNLLHDIFVKGRTSPVYMESLFDRIFSVPSMAILFQKLDKDDKTQDARDVLEASLTKQAGEKISSQDKELVAEWFG